MVDTEADMEVKWVDMEVDMEVKWADMVVRWEDTVDMEAARVVDTGARREVVTGWDMAIISTSVITISITDTLLDTPPDTEVDKAVERADLEVERVDSEAERVEADSVVERVAVDSVVERVDSVAERAVAVEDMADTEADGRELFSLYKFVNIVPNFSPF